MEKKKTKSYNQLKRLCEKQKLILILMKWSVVLPKKVISSKTLLNYNQFTIELLLHLGLATLESSKLLIYET